MAEQSKQVCVRLDTPKKLNAHYASRKTLFRLRASLLCAACLDDVKHGKVAAVEGNGLKLHKKMFAEKIFDPLFMINNEYFGPQGITTP